MRSGLRARSRRAGRQIRAQQIPTTDTISEVGFNVIPAAPWEVGQTIDVCAVLENFGTEGQESESYPVRLNGSQIGEVQTFVPAGETRSACLSTPVPDTSFLEVEVVGIPGLISGEVLGGSDGGGGGTNGGTNGGDGTLTEISTDTITIANTSIQPSSVAPDQESQVSWDWVNNSGVPDNEIQADYRLFAGGVRIRDGGGSLPTSTTEHVIPNRAGLPAGTHDVVLEYGVAPLFDDPITFETVNLGTLSVQSGGDGGGGGGGGGQNGDIGAGQQGLVLGVAALGLGALYALTRGDRQ